MITELNDELVWSRLITGTIWWKFASQKYLNTHFVYPMFYIEMGSMNTQTPFNFVVFDVLTFHACWKFLNILRVVWIFFQNEWPTSHHKLLATTHIKAFDNVDFWN